MDPHTPLWPLTSYYVLTFLLKFLILLLNSVPEHTLTNYIVLVIESFLVLLSSEGIQFQK